MDFSKIARDEEFSRVAALFDQISKVEKFHESRYRKLINNLANDEVFRKKMMVKWQKVRMRAEDIVWIEEASKALKQEPIKLEFLEEALVA